MESEVETSHIFILEEFEAPGRAASEESERQKRPVSDYLQMRNRPLKKAASRISFDVEEMEPGRCPLAWIDEPMSRQP